jgi:hypothetical protein
MSGVFSNFFSRSTSCAKVSIISEYLSDQLIGHVSRDSTAINAIEKPHKLPVKEEPAKKRGHPKKGEERIKEPTRLEKQVLGITIHAMLSDLPIIKEHSRSLGHVPIVDTRPKRGKKAEIERELKAKRNAN